MGLVLVAVGVAGTRIGGVGTYGVAGDVVNQGLWSLWYAVNTLLALVLVGCFFAVPFRRLQVKTLAEVFLRRFGSRRCQVLTSLCVQTEYLIVNVLEPFVIGTILFAVTDLPFGVCVMSGAFLLIVYTSLGGLWGSAVTNLIHCSVIIVGLLLVALVGTSDLGGFAGVSEAIDGRLSGAGLEPSVWWSFVGAGWGAVLAMFFSATVHTPAASVYVNFSAAAKKESSLIPAFLVGGLLAAVMPVLAGWIGALTLARYGLNSGLRNYQMITQLAIDTGPWLAGIALAAILAAVISSGGPILLSSATMIVRDWLPARFRGAKELRSYRVATVIYGLVAGLIAWQAEISSVLDLLLVGFAMVVPPAVALGYVIYWPKTTERGAFWGMVSGYGVGLIWYLSIRWALAAGFEVTETSSALHRLLHWAFVNEGEGVDPSYPTTLIPLLAVPLISVLWPHGSEDTARRLQFFGTVRRRLSAQG